MSALMRDLDPILDRAESAALALDGAGLTESVSALSAFGEQLESLEDPSLRRHFERRLLRLRGLCGGLSGVLAEALGVEETYGVRGEKVGGPSRSSTRGYV